MCWKLLYSITLPIVVNVPHILEKDVYSEVWEESYKYVHYVKVANGVIQSLRLHLVKLLKAPLWGPNQLINVPHQVGNGWGDQT